MSENADLKYYIDMQPIGRRIEVKPGTSILKAAQAAGVGLVSLCGGEGWCQSCLVRIADGDVSNMSATELAYLSDIEIKEGYRLACQTYPESDLRIDIPPESLSTPQRLQVEGQEVEVVISPLVKVIDMEITPPGLHDLRPDTRRLQDALAAEGYSGTRFELPLLESLADDLRQNKWKVRVALRNGEVIAVLPAETGVYGIAVDIGTTKVALYLVDLVSGEVVDKSGEMNPQIAYGEDVISRISYTRQEEDGRQTLQHVIVDELNKMLANSSKKLGIEQSQLLDAVIVGNTAIHHLFAGLPVEQLVYAPYVPEISEGLDFRAADIGLQLAVGAYVHLLPNIAGYVGADHAAVILSTELWKQDKNVMAIDIGTNTEISLVSKGKIYSCSCASGPAFEGAHIKDGMRAAPGAIERVQIVDGEIRIFTINNEPPVGICGSGILDAVAEMKEVGILNEKGALIEGALNVSGSGKNNLEFTLSPPESSGVDRAITITRKDVNEIQLAKAAIRAGQEVLLAKAGVKAEDLDEVIIAGAFGTYIDVPNAIKIGMFPRIPEDRFKQVGNAAGMGARLALLSEDQRNKIAEVIEDVEYVELTTYEDFQKKFVDAIYLR